MLLDADLVVLHERHLEQADLLEPLAQTADNDLLDDGVGLLRVLRILLRGGDTDLLFLLHVGGGDVALVEILRVERADLHGDVAAELGDGLDGGFGLKLDEHGDLALHVDIRNALALDALEAADLHVLTDGEEELVLRIVHGALAGVPGARHESVDIGGSFLGDDLRHAGDELVEERAASDEVGFAVDFDDHADTVDDRGVRHALGGDAGRLLGLGSQTLFTQINNGLLEIALVLDERLLAVHQAAAGGLAQLVNGSSGNSSHYSSSFAVSAASTVSASSP